LIRAATCFSGIGAPEMGLPSARWLWHAEFEAFPSAVMAHRHPDSVNLGDVTADEFMQRASSFGPLDLLVGGPPCQAFSVAGLRQSLSDDRGNLSLRWVEIVNAARPRIAVTENVPGWLNTPDNAFGCFLGAIVGADDALHPVGDGGWPGAGMVAGPRARLAWRVLDAQYFGVAQRRRRVFVVSSADPGVDPAAILFEPRGLRRHPPSRGETGEGTAHELAPCLSSGGRGVERTGETRGQDPVVADIVAMSSGQANAEVRTDGGAPALTCLHEAPIVTHALRGEGFDASEDGTGRGTPIVPIAYRTTSNQGCYETGHEVDALTTGTDPASHIVVFDTTQITHPANRSNPKPGDPEHPLAAGAHAPAVAFNMHKSGNDASSMGVAVDQTDCLRAFEKSPFAIQHGCAVRRLTPTECERLQGFPDGYTNIFWRSKDEAPDGPRYKALGNSMAVPCIGWILRRCSEALFREAQARIAADAGLLGDVA